MLLVAGRGVLGDGTPWFCEYRATLVHFRGRPHCLQMVRDITEGMVVNLGIGLPTLVPNYVADDVELVYEQASQYLMTGYRPLPTLVKLKVPGTAGAVPLTSDASSVSAVSKVLLLLVSLNRRTVVPLRGVSSAVMPSAVRSLKTVPLTVMFWKMPIAGAVKGVPLWGLTGMAAAGKEMLEPAGATASIK